MDNCKGCKCKDCGLKNDCDYCGCGICGFANKDMTQKDCNAYQEEKDGEG
jgi:hypothetical protein